MDKHTIAPAKCAEYLKTYNHWRRGGLASQPNPIELGQHIDVAIELIGQRDDLLAALKWIEGMAFDAPELRERARMAIAKAEGQ